MALILQVSAALVGGVAAARLIALRSPQFKRAPLAGVGLAATLTAGVLFCDHVYGLAGKMSEETATDSAVPSFEAQHAADLSANNEFLAWARRRMLDTGRGAYYLEPAKILQEPELAQWSTYTLLPERATSSLEDANWIVFYGAAPARIRGFDHVATFSPGFGLAARSDAG